MKTLTTTLIKFGVAGFLIWFLVQHSKLDLDLLTTLLQSPLLLTMTILLYIVVIFAGAWRWYLLNQAQKIDLSYSRTLLPSYLGVAFNNIAPGAIGGDFLRFYFINKRGNARKSAIMLTILFDRITGLLGIFIAVCCIACFQLPIFLQEKMTFYFFLFCCAICTGGLACFLLLILLPDKLNLTQKLEARFGHKKIFASILSLLDAIKVYRHSKLAIVQCLLISTFIQCLIAITCILIAKIMGFEHIAFTHAIIAVGITQIVNLIPLSPGGFGIGEMAFANVLALLDPSVGANSATIFLAYRLIGICLYLPSLSIFVFDKSIKSSQLQP